MSNPVCACQTPPVADSTTTRVVTLVHGTFARHADWIQDGQKLTNALHMTGPDTVLDRFCWSGKNRHMHRLEAGDALRQHLVRLIKTYREAGAQADHHVIAHSHGGNVVLYALRERGDADDAVLADVHVVTLATPFLFMRERVMSRWLFAVLPLYLLIALSIGMEESAPFSGANILWALIGVWCLIGILAFPLSLALYARRGVTPAVRDLMSGNAAFQEAKRITVPDINPERLLVIRGLGDEASGSLIAAQSINWIMTKLSGMFRSWPALMFWTFIAGVFSAVVVELLGLAGDAFDAGFELTIGTVLVAFFLGPLIALPIIAGFIAVANVAFGMDALFWNYSAQTTAEHSPRGLSQVLIVGMRQFRYNALSHSVYDDGEAIEAMVNWITPVTGGDTKPG